MPSVDIRADHLAIVQEILQQQVPEAEVWVFGSRAKWLARDTSDLDLCLRADAPLSFERMGLLAEAFENSNLPYKVDVVDWAALSDSFRQIIERDKVGLSDWQPFVLGEVCKKIGSGATPRGGKEAYLGGATALIRSQNVYNERFVRDGLAYIDDAQADELRNVVVEENDVLLNITGDSVARCCQVPADILPARVNQHVAIIRPDKNVLDAEFLRYALISPKGQAHLLALASAGATRNALTKAMIEALAIIAPSDIEQQREIARILSTLDDRIENLRQTNATLEAIAAALFKSWFVDFDDVAPEDMQESELGLIPKGWRVGPFVDAMEILGGGTPKTAVAEYWNGDIPWFSVVDAPANGQVFVLDTEKKITEFGLQNCSAKLLPEMTTIITARGTVGKVALVGVPMAMNQSCYALRPKQKNGEAFVYFSTLRFVEHLQRIAHGAVFDTITRDSFKQVITCLPSDETVLAFGEIANPLLERIRANGQQAISLAKLRDALLPRLISGQLRVSDAEHIAEEAT